MKSVKSLFHSLLGLCLVTSCIESDEAVDLTSMPRQTITIEASQEARRVETRTTLQTDGSVFWNPSDEISLFFNSGTNGGDKFVSQNSENVAIAEFSGSIQGITGGGENLEENAYFWAVYPYSEGNSCDGSSIVTTLPYKQQAVEGTFADDLFITIARSPSVKMAFKNVCGGVKFCVSKSGIESVIFRGNSGENLAGKVRVSFDENNKPAVTEVIDGQSEVVVTAPNGGTFEPGKYYYIITLPTPLESGFEMIFRKSDNTKIVYKRTSGVVINRSRFGVVENVDSGEAVPDDTPTGGSESGFYLGIIGFNNGLYTYPIQHLSNRSIAGYNSFIDGLTTINGTLLYYAVDKSIDQLQAATFPSNLYDVSIVTFTDGLDRGSLDEGGYLSNTEYLAALNTRLTGEKVSDKSITAYSIGVRGDDVTNYTSFQNNLKNLATSNDNVFEVSDMSEVNEVFLKIADLLGETKYFQKLTLKIKGPSHNEKCRFTFDNVSSYNYSQCYIEGTFNRVDKTLTDVKYVGLSSDSGTVINSYKNEENFYVFTFDGVQAADGTLVPTDNVLHWYTEGGVWEKDSEFDFDPGDVSVEKIERSAAIILNLDCSSSLEGDAFATLQRHAKSFIAKLCENITDPYEVASISLNQTAVTMSVGTNKTLSATVLPTTAVRKDVEYSSTNAAVASVDKNGKITAHKPGAATIIARTKDGGLTAVCNTVVMSDESIIRYTSTDGKIVTPYKTDVFGVNIVSNTYEDGVGIITFDGPVTSIGDYAFSDCSSLKSVTIPCSVGFIGIGAFDNCCGLVSIHCTPLTPPMGSSIMFRNVAERFKIYVPSTAVETYKIATYWEDYVRNSDYQVIVAEYANYPKDLHLAIRKDGSRYYISKEECDETTLSDILVEGITVVDMNTYFIISLKDVQINPISSITMAFELYGDIMPTSHQGEIISTKWDSINKTINYFGGTPLYSDRYYYTTETKSSSGDPMTDWVDGIMGVQRYTSCIHGPGGILYDSTNTAPYVRGITN